jgi:hypothetical protein
MECTNVNVFVTFPKVSVVGIYCICPGVY